MHTSVCYLKVECIFSELKQKVYFAVNDKNDMFLVNCFIIGVTGSVGVRTLISKN